MKDDSIFGDVAAILSMFIAAIAVSFFAYDTFVDLEEIYWICEALKHPYESGLL